MKIYEKPILMVLSVSANDALCNACGTSINSISDLKGPLSFLDANNNGIIDESEAVGYFGNAPDTCTSTMDVTGYCKFTGAENNLTQVFAS